MGHREGVHGLWSFLRPACRRVLRLLFQAGKRSVCMCRARPLFVRSPSRGPRCDRTGFDPAVYPLSCRTEAAWAFRGAAHAASDWPARLNAASRRRWTADAEQSGFCLPVFGRRSTTKEMIMKTILNTLAVPVLALFVMGAMPALAGEGCCSARPADKPAMCACCKCEQCACKTCTCCKCETCTCEKKSE